MISPSADQSAACKKRTRNGSQNHSGARGGMSAEFFTAINEQRSNRSLLRADDAIQIVCSSLDCQDKWRNSRLPSCAPISASKPSCATRDTLSITWRCCETTTARSSGRRLKRNKRPIIYGHSPDRWRQPMPLFRNFYRCDRCGNEWEDVWSATCDDDCPSAARHMSPYKSEDADDD